MTGGGLLLWLVLIATGIMITKTISRDWKESAAKKRREKWHNDQMRSSIGPQWDDLEFRKKWQEEAERRWGGGRLDEQWQRDLAQRPEEDDY